MKLHNTPNILIASNIDNFSRYDGDSFGISASASYSNPDAPTNSEITNNKSDTYTTGAYNPDSSGVSKSIGYGSDSDSQTSTTYSGINTSNITITGNGNTDTPVEAGTGIQTDDNGMKTITAANLADIFTSTTTDTITENSGALANTFDAEAVQNELDVQTRVTQTFDTNRQEVSIIIDTKIKDLQDEANEAALAGDLEKAEELKNLVDNWKQGGLIVDGIANALYAPNGNGAIGTIAEVASPELVAIVGDYFKETNQENTTQHIVAQSLLGAAIAAATGNDELMGAVNSGGSVVLAPIVANWLYGDSKDLTAEQQATVSNIVSLAMSSLDAATSLNTNSVVNTNLQSQNVVNNNALETGWDIVNVFYDGGKIVVGYAIGDKVLTKEGWIDLGVDSIAVLIPFVPAGITKIDDVVDGARNFNKITDSYLKQKGFDAHKIKSEIVGKNNISKFDLYLDKASGEIFILLKGGKGEPMSTGYKIK